MGRVQKKIRLHETKHPTKNRTTLNRPRRNISSKEHINSPKTSHIVDPLLAHKSASFLGASMLSHHISTKSLTTRSLISLMECQYCQDQATHASPKKHMQENQNPLIPLPTTSLHQTWHPLSLPKCWYVRGQISTSITKTQLPPSLASCDADI